PRAGIRYPEANTEGEFFRHTHASGPPTFPRLVTGDRWTNATDGTAILGRTAGCWLPGYSGIRLFRHPVGVVSLRHGSISHRASGDTRGSSLTTADVPAIHGGRRPGRNAVGNRTDARTLRGRHRRSQRTSQRRPGSTGAAVGHPRGRHRYSPPDHLADQRFGR